MSWPPQSVNSLKLERLVCQFSEKKNLLILFTKLRYTEFNQAKNRDGEVDAEGQYGEGGRFC